MLEELREAQRERWRAEARCQGALDHLRFFEEKSRLLEADVLSLSQELMRERSRLEAHADGLEQELSRVSRELNEVRESKSWRTIVRIRRVKATLPFSGQ